MISLTIAYKPQDNSHLRGDFVIRLTTSGDNMRTLSSFGFDESEGCDSWALTREQASMAAIETVRVAQEVAIAVRNSICADVDAESWRVARALPDQVR